MERTEIFRRVEGILKNVLAHSDFTLTDVLTASEVRGWDSLSHMIIISDIESAFGIRFKLRELSKLENMGSLIDLIERKLQP